MHSVFIGFKSKAKNKSMKKKSSYEFAPFIYTYSIITIIMHINGIALENILFRYLVITMKMSF